MPARKNAAAAKRELIDVGKSLATDRRTRARNVASSGQGDRGDRKR